MLALASLMSPNADFLVNSIAGYLEERLGTGIRIVHDVPWQERELLLDEGRIDIAWICGLPYVVRADQPTGTIELLAAAVMAGERYHKRPVYFSDVVVREDSRFRTFADLRHSVWAYTERNSHSGYNVVRYYLATIMETNGYFDRVIESGSHLRSLQLILKGEVDASAIDSTVLELEYLRLPTLRSQLSVVETLGPSPIPPWVVLKSVPRQLKSAIRDSLLHMNGSIAGKKILAKGQLARFVRVIDPDYDVIRFMAKKASTVLL